MPTGRLLSTGVKRVIYNMFMGGMTALTLLSSHNDGTNSSVSLSTIQNICSFLNNSTIFDIDHWLNEVGERREHAGRPRRLSNDEVNHLLLIMRDNNAMKLHTAARIL
jgi:hypothetical protein